MSDEDDDAPALPAAKGRRLPVGRKAVVTKLWRAAKRQLDAHEARLDGLPPGAGASEADAKALAVLARTVRELMVMEGASTAQQDKAADESDTADGLRYAAELRKELARRLDGLAAEYAGAASEAPAGDGDI